MCHAEIICILNRTYITCIMHVFLYNGEYLAPQIRNMNSRFHLEAKLSLVI